MPNAPRQRRSRRAFDREEGIAKAQAVFHRHGFDGVGVAALTEALDINPPSLYAAYGSKAGLYQRVLERYIAQEALPLPRIFTESGSLGKAVARLYIEAANRYGRDASCRGCLVTEGTRAADPEARSIAAKIASDMVDAIRLEIAHRAPGRAELLSDLIATTLRGFSAAAYAGMPADRLLAVARLSGEVLACELERDQADRHR